MNKTPETNDLARGNHVVPTEWAEQLERERDEAREAFKISYNERVKIELERNEALGQVKELIYIAGRAIDLAEIDFENDKFGVVSELRYELRQIMREGAK